MISQILERARALDAADPLREFRAQFVSDEPLTYLDGNSLGRLPLRTQARMRTVVDHGWGSRLIRSWPESWINLPAKVGAKIATLIGAQPSEVICADSVSVNLFKLAAAALKTDPNRHVIVTSEDNFPSDLYVFDGLKRLFPNLEIRFGLDKVNEETALVSLSHVEYRRGSLLDMRQINEVAQRAGALTLWDLSHSVGAVQIELNQTGADMAVGCTYKYLNGGPGAPAFLYVRSELLPELHSPIQGWFGHQSPFEFGPNYEPAPGIERFQAGTPPVLSMSAVDASLDVTLEAGMEAIHAKAVELTEFAIELYDGLLAPVGFELLTPREAKVRGSHVSFGHSAASQIEKALIQNHRIVPDFRPPNIVRFGFTPLYVGFEDVAAAIFALKSIVETGEYSRFPAQTRGVT